jgi:Ca2+-dependent lipid-binding protein
MVRCVLAFSRRGTNIATVGDTMIRELDFSKITLRIIEHVDNDGDDNDDHVIAKLTGNTIDTLRTSLVSGDRS